MTIALTRRRMMAAALAAGVTVGPGRLFAQEAESLSQQLAGAIVGIRGVPIGADVAERTAWTLLDCMGAMIHGAGQRAIRADITIFTDRHGQPSSSVVAHAGLVPVELAAAANAYLLHAEEIDDSDLAAQLRASAVIMPTALAMAEMLDVTGAQFLASVALGYTLQRRLAAPLGPVQRLGWMASGVWGPPAAAAMAADMMGLPPPAIASALALAASASGGSFQYFYDQTEEKRLIVARGARTAIESARLSANGYDGAARILEGQAGLYRLIGGSEFVLPRSATLIGGLEAREGPLFIHPKYFSASSSIIPMLEGLAVDLPLGFDASSIERFTVRGSAAWGRVLASKINDYATPATRMGAMINFSYMVALFILRLSALPGDLTPSTLADPAIEALARRGSFVVSEIPEIVIDFELRNARNLRVTARTPALDSPAALERTQRLAKFDALTAPLLTATARERTRAACLAIGKVRSMRAWARQIRTLKLADVA